MTATTDTNAAVTILPCPMPDCGSDIVGTGKRPSGDVTVSCGRCQLSIVGEGDTVTAIKRWNAIPRELRHEREMAAYTVACKYGHYESEAFKLVDEMFACFAAPSIQSQPLTYNEVGSFLYEGNCYVATSSDDPRSVKLYRPTSPIQSQPKASELPPLPEGVTPEEKRAIVSFKQRSGDDEMARASIGVEFLPLPEERMTTRIPGCGNGLRSWFTDDQMHAYVLADRARQAAALTDAQVDSLRQIGQSWMSESGRYALEDWIDSQGRQAAAIAQPSGAVPDGWKDRLYAAMDAAFELRENGPRDADNQAQGMVSDDTQIGVEFAMNWFEKNLLAAAPQPPASTGPVRTKLKEMQNDEGEIGWYFDCDGHYIDVERDKDGKFSIFFRDRSDGKEGWLDQASAPEVQASAVVGSIGSEDEFIIHLDAYQWNSIESYVNGGTDEARKLRDNAKASLIAFIDARSAASAKDAERLEFLMERGAWIAWGKDGESCRLFHRSEDGESMPMLGWGARHWSHDPREAIDAARAAIATTKAAK